VVDEALAADPTLVDLLDLPPGHIAYRDDVGGPLDPPGSAAPTTAVNSEPWRSDLDDRTEHFAGTVN
jgi:hypothetical protein